MPSDAFDGVELTPPKMQMSSASEAIIDQQAEKLSVNTMCGMHVAPGRPGARRLGLNAGYRSVNSLKHRCLDAPQGIGLAIHAVE